MIKEITYVTSNPRKLAAAREILAQYNIEVKQIDIETPEIQANDVAEVAKFSAKWAAEKLNKPVVVNDVSWSITALNGFPGPYLKYIGKTIGTKGLLKLIEDIDNREIIFKEAIAYCVPGKEPIVETGTIKGKLSKEIRGEVSPRWPIGSLFIPDGYDRTWHQMSEEERNIIVSTMKTWDKIAEKVKEA